MNKILIMVKDDEVKLYLINEKNPIDWAKYQLQRRIEKEGWEASEAYLVNEKDALPVQKWVDDYWKEQEKIDQKLIEENEKKEFERLKKKFN